MAPASSPAWLVPSPGSRWQLERVGYFVFDTVDSRPDAPILNRIVTLRDSWQSEVASRRRRRRLRGQARTNTRPPKRSRIEYRAEARVRDPLLADRFATWPSRYGLGEGEVDLLTGDRPTGDLFEDAVGSGAPPDVVARWVINELPRELGDRPLDETPLTGTGTGRAGTGCRVGRDHRSGGQGRLCRDGPARRRPSTDHRRARSRSGQRRGRYRRDRQRGAGCQPDRRWTSTAPARPGFLGFFVGQVVRSSQGKANPRGCPATA